MTPFDHEIASRTAYMEAGGEGVDGIRAVAAVLFNRLRSRRWSTTLAGVCLAREQFSCWNSDRVDGGLRLRCAELSDDDPTLNLCRAAVDDAVAGADDPTGGATHYYSVSMLGQPPDWTVGATFTVQIGRHRFYRDIA